MAKRTKATVQKDWKAKFLDELAQCGVVGDACRAVGVCRNTAYEHRNADAAFAAKWAEALSEYVEKLEKEADRRAVDGVDEPAGWYQGVAGGKVRKYSDTLLMFRLKKLDPSYRDRHEISGPDGGPLQTETKVTFYIPKNGKEKV